MISKSNVSTLKLSLKNAKKNIWDYGIYFITLTLGVAIFYVFNAAFDQNAMQVMDSKIMVLLGGLETLMNFISYFTAAILGFLILYANNFFIRNRKKEIGLYMILGMKRRNVSVIVTLETVIIAIVSFVSGIILGVLLSQLMSLFTVSLFEVDMTKYRLVFSIKALIKSMIYYFSIFVLVVLFNNVVIAKTKLINLLHGKRKNDNIKRRKKLIDIPVFIISIICFVISYKTYLDGKFFLDPNESLKVIILGVVGIFTFYYSLTSIIGSFYNKNKKSYYKGLNMYSTRQFMSRINTNFITLSIISISLLLAIGIFSSAYSTKEVLNTQARAAARYDYTLFMSDYTSSEGFDEKIKEFEEIKKEGYSNDFIYNKIPDNIKNSGYIKDYVEFPVYTDGRNWDSIIKLEENEFIQTNYMSLEYMKESDFNKILDLIGKEKIELENEYLIVSDSESKDLKQKIIDESIYLKFNKTVLKPVNYNENKFKEASNISVSNSYYDTIIVVPDELIEQNLIQNLNLEKINLNIECNNKEDNQKLYDLVAGNSENLEKSFVENTIIKNKIDVLNQNNTIKVGFTFIGIYFGIVFIIACSAILAINMLLTITSSKESYILLRKIGANERLIKKSIFIQVASYFVLPLIVAFINAIVGMSGIIKMLSLMGNIDILGNVKTTLIFVVGIYFLYFIITYISAKRIIK